MDAKQRFQVAVGGFSAGAASPAAWVATFRVQHWAGKLRCSVYVMYEGSNPLTMQEWAWECVLAARDPMWQHTDQVIVASSAVLGLRSVEYLGDWMERDEVAQCIVGYLVGIDKSEHMTISDVVANVERLASGHILPPVPDDLVAA